MRVLVLFSHPVETSYGAALHKQVVESLTKAGHEVDDCDLYAENFQPVLTREERIRYHDYPENTGPVAGYVERLQKAEALVIVSPVWNFGFPAMLKGYFDRVWLPGVTFALQDGKLTPTLRHITKLASVLTYGATPMRAFLAGNPPKKIITRTMRAQIKIGAPIKFMAHYDMNNCTPETRANFLRKVKGEMEAF
ncbi:NAD(P)H-dependent oxidoreductase [Martelella mediterranea]|uniref:Putative NADPH-quinone reductase n=1 Tax=Martelella mediterranea TaxID=293089 RepID=A0A4R3NYK9_9HYPH|nr:NAD(P)H-dependent oxidoreductase [Martelella mediterranea]TCT45055.1 putative NADPH-quinone reductase [Martelella mediterranea]